MLDEFSNLDGRSSDEAVTMEWDCSVEELGDDEDYFNPNTFDQRLIEEIRKYPELFDDKNPDYHDKLKKEAVWKDVSLVMDRKVLDCKKRWRCLRDGYRRYQKNPKQYEHVGTRKRTLFALLSFLENVEVRRFGARHFRNANSRRSSRKANNTENPVIVRYGAQDGPLIKTELASPSTDDAASYAPEPKQPKPAIQYFVLKPDCVKTPLDQHFEQQQPPQEDEIDSFLRLMGQTIKKFSPRFQIEAKKKIFESVTEIELRNCQEST